MNFTYLLSPSGVTNMLFPNGVTNQDVCRLILFLSTGVTNIHLGCNVHIELMIVGGCMHNNSIPMNTINDMNEGGMHRKKVKSGAE